MEIIDAVQRSAHLYLTPNDSMGYGIPNFGLAYEILLSETDTTVVDTTGGGDTTEIDTTILEIFNVLPNPASDFFTVWINTNYNQVAELRFFNMIGEMIYEEKIYLNSDVANQFTIDTRKNFAPGLYLFTVSGNGFKQTSKVFVE
jgi:Secretion system C-terminal sorting domain